MIRSVLAGFLFLFVTVSSASALNCAAYPNTLANGTNADATQVMGNFNLIRDCANNNLAATSGATFTGPTFFTGGNVGIGTTTPGPGLSGAAYFDKILQILGSNNAIVGSILALTTTNTVSGSYTGSIEYFVSGISANDRRTAYIASQLTATAGSTVTGDLEFATNPGSGPVNRLTITSAGNVGIATTTPTFTLQVNGSVAGVGAYNNTSDGRLKKDVASLEYGLDTILKLRPVGFNWIAQDQEWKKQHQIGLIAQEVEPVVPEAVTTANDELQTKSLAYSELIPVLIKAVQDLKSANDNLRAANDNGAAQIATLTARLDAIEAAHMTKAAATSPSLLR